MRWRLSKPKREQLHQHLPVRDNYSPVSCGCYMCSMEKHSGIWAALASLGVLDWIPSVKVEDHVIIYMDWLLLYAKPSYCQPLQQMFSRRLLSSSINRGKGPRDSYERVAQNIIHLQRLVLSDNDLVLSNNDLVSSNNDLVLSNNDLVLSNNDLVLSNNYHLRKITSLLVFFVLSYSLRDREMF